MSPGKMPVDSCKPSADHSFNKCEIRDTPLQIAILMPLKFFKKRTTIPNIFFMRLLSFENTINEKSFITDGILSCARRVVYVL